MQQQRGQGGAGSGAVTAVRTVSAVLLESSATSAPMGARSAGTFGGQATSRPAIVKSVMPAQHERTRLAQGTGVTRDVAATAPRELSGALIAFVDTLKPPKVDGKPKSVTSGAAGTSRLLVGGSTTGGTHGRENLNFSITLQDESGELVPARVREAAATSLLGVDFATYQRTAQVVPSLSALVVEQLAGSSVDAVVTGTGWNARVLSARFVDGSEGAVVAIARSRGIDIV